MGERKLQELASVIRSKNAGPFVLTLDVFFKDRESFGLVRDSGSITASSVAALYGIPEADVIKVVFFEPAHALKICLKRLIPSATAGDTDVFGAQQHVPLMEMEID
ncbi:MAG: DUF4387 domain-containing protein [bacterium]